VTFGELDLSLAVCGVPAGGLEAVAAVKNPALADLAVAVEDAGCDTAGFSGIACAGTLSPAASVACFAWSAFGGRDDAVPCDEGSGPTGRRALGMVQTFQSPPWLPGGGVVTHQRHAEDPQLTLRHVQAARLGVAQKTGLLSACLQVSA